MLPGAQAAAAIATPGAARKTSTVIRPAGPNPTEPVTIDNKAGGQLVVKPDGNIVWEVDHRQPRRTYWNDRWQELAQIVVGCTLMMGVVNGSTAGSWAMSDEMSRARRENYVLTGRHLMELTAVTTSTAAAGTIVGLAYAPLLAARMILGRVARPLLVVGGLWAVRRAARVVSAIRGASPAALLALLDGTADLERQLAALTTLAIKAACSAAFRRKLCSIGGVERLLALLPQVMDGNLLEALVRTLEALAQEADAQEVMLATAAVPYLAHTLEHPDERVVQATVGTLARLAARPDGRKAIRDCGALPALLTLTGPATPSGMQERAVALAAALASDADTSGALLEAGGVPALLAALHEPMPRTAVKEQAAKALHALTRTCPEAQGRLRNQPGASSTLTALQAAWGDAWYASKPDVHLLVGLAAPRPAVASDEGDAPVMVEAPDATA